MGHAERAATLLQRELFVPLPASFSEGVVALAARMAADRHAVHRSACTVLAMAYHNGALAHERLGALEHARVSLARCDAGVRVGEGGAPTTLLLPLGRG